MCTLVIEITPYYALQLKKMLNLFYVYKGFARVRVRARARARSTHLVLVEVRGCQVPWNWSYRQL